MLRLGIYQGGDVSGVEKNLKIMDEVVHKHSGKVDLWCFPELFACGYVDGDYIRTAAEPADGATFAHVSELAKKYNTAIVFGYAERDAKESKTLYNSALFVGPDGKRLSNYRKTHLYGEYERSVFTPGDKFASLVEFKGVKVGLLICYGMPASTCKLRSGVCADLEFVEPCRILAMRGAELILVPTANTNHFNCVYTVASRCLSINVCRLHVCCCCSELLNRWRSWPTSTESAQSTARS